MLISGSFSIWRRPILWPVESSLSKDEAAECLEEELGEDFIVHGIQPT